MAGVSEPIALALIAGVVAIAIAQTRRALADCEDKRALAVEHADLVSNAFGTK